ncbi:hypothetical protein [Tychonema sp. LEGE 07196]|nr:hypothetical protein [Tychonema sp. LEGE 07196]
MINACFHVLWSIALFGKDKRISKVVPATRSIHRINREHLESQILKPPN